MKKILENFRRLQYKLNQLRIYAHIESKKQKFSEIFFKTYDEIEFKLI